MHRKILASGGAENTIILWDASSPSTSFHLTRIPAHTDWVNDVAFSPDGNILASGSDDATVILGNVSVPVDPIKVATLLGHTGEVKDFAFSPDGRTLASGSYHSTVILWDISNPAAPAQLSEIKGEGSMVAILQVRNGNNTFPAKHIIELAINGLCNLKTH